MRLVVAKLYKTGK